MTILESHVYHDNAKSMEPYLKLRVINLWDFTTKPHCFRDGISYALYLCTPQTFNLTGWKRVDDLTEEQKLELQKLGYTLGS